MTTITLIAKANNPKQLRQVEDFLKTEFGELDLELKVSVNPTSKWLQVSLSGEDEAIATNYVKQKIGTCPVSVENVSKGSILKGYIQKIDQASQRLILDIGIFEPKPVLASVSLDYLQTNLMKGKHTPLDEICQLFGFRPGLPLKVIVCDVTLDAKNALPAEFSPDQLEQIDLWKRSLLDRLIVLNASLGEVEAVLERTRLNRDIIHIDELGMFEHALVCKLGTDAAGLVSVVGRYMRNAVFIVYNSRKIMNFIG